MLQFIDYEVRADLSTSYNVERKRCVADDQDITRTRSTFWMKKHQFQQEINQASGELVSQDGETGEPLMCVCVCGLKEL